ncbi:Serine/threonine-protein kinase pim-2 [Desmophyllum pertusum]|uniref:Serine/threonine-protein kinase pim-2 n=1 Tax=Desmophyllum pertusum TaxID=174260 RepID=A0A9W9ZR12_9CNID|nr:Serine/threonine-protein kinase pim-2 [Desmophyllum pertusum]
MNLSQNSEAHQTTCLLNSGNPGNMTAVQGTVWQMGILLVDMLSPVVPAFEHPRHALSMTPRVPRHLSPEAKNLIYSLLNATPSNRPTLQQTLQHPWFRHDVILKYHFTASLSEKTS